MNERLPFENSSHQRLWITLGHDSRKGTLLCIFLFCFLNALSTARKVPSSSIIFKRKQRSVLLISIKPLTHKINKALEVKGKNRGMENKETLLSKHKTKNNEEQKY